MSLLATSTASSSSSESTDETGPMQALKGEAKELLDGRLVRDVAGVVELAAPVNAPRKERADQVAASIASAFEKQLVSQRKPGNDRGLFKWIRRGANAMAEKKLYGYLGALTKFVAKKMRSTVEYDSSDSPLPLRTISINKQVDVHAEGSEHLLDRAIAVEALPFNLGTNQPAMQASSRPKYRSIFAIAEAKKSNRKKDFESACAQLLVYSREMYIAQWNRRFLWGLTMCGDSIRACHFGNDLMQVSRDMRLFEAEGRAEFIKLLVYWSFCEEHCLGYDPTMVWLPDRRCWRMEVPTLPPPDGEPAQSSGTVPFYTRTALTVSENMFGRRTRIYLATSNKPTCIEDAAEDMCNIVIKDAWTESTEDQVEDSRDEIRHLCKIKQKLSGMADVAGSYPAIVAGGRVTFDRGDGNAGAEDTAKSVYQHIYDSLSVGSASRSDESSDSPEDKPKMPFRAHKRVASKSYGMPIRHLKSVQQFIVVMADVMRVHSRIYQHAHILHRDISNDNILFYKTEEYPYFRGLLIDFDHAIDFSHRKQIRH
ncbi:hypothetical protein GGI07_003973, partial [Coemansia sp. Benny D115]